MTTTENLSSTTTSREEYQLQIKHVGDNIVAMKTIDRNNGEITGLMIIDCAMVVEVNFDSWECLRTAQKFWRVIVHFRETMNYNIVPRPIILTLTSENDVINAVRTIKNKIFTINFKQLVRQGFERNKTTEKEEASANIDRLID